MSSKKEGTTKISNNLSEVGQRSARTEEECHVISKEGAMCILSGGGSLKVPSGSVYVYVRTSLSVSSPFPPLPSPPTQPPSPTFFPESRKAHILVPEPSNEWHGPGNCVMH